MMGYADMIEALAANYLHVYIIDPSSDSADVVKLNGDIVRQSDTLNYTRTLLAFADGNVYPKDRAYVLKALSCRALLDHFAEDTDHLDVTYRVLDEEAVPHFYAAHYTRISKADEPLKLLAGFRNIDSVIEMQHQTHHEGLFNAYSAVSGMFLLMYRVNLRTGTFYSIKDSESTKSYLLPNCNSFEPTIRNIMEGLADESYRKIALDFVDCDTLKERMRGTRHIATEVLGKVSGWCKLHFVREDPNESDNFDHVLFVIDLMDEDKNYAVVEALARNFENVYWTNLNNGTARILKLEDKFVNGRLSKNNHHPFPFNPLLDQWIEEDVHPEDRQMMHHALSLDNLRKVFAAQDEYLGNYRVVHDGVITNYQFRLLKMKADGCIIAAFQNIDAIIEEHLAEEKKQREKEEKYQRNLEEQLSVLNALARNFKNLYLIDLENGSAKVIKLEDEYTDGRLNDLLYQSFPYEGLMNAWISEAVHPDDREMLSKALSPAHLREIFARQSEYIGNYRMLVNNKVIHYQFNLCRLSEKGRLIAGFQNIDAIIEEHLEQEKKERAREEAYQQQLIAANHAKTEFLQRMSHDIRTPINGILGMLDIAEHFSNDLQKQLECREKIKRSAELLLTLVNEVLDMSKLESGTMTFEHISFDLVNAIDDMLAAAQIQAQSGDIEIIRADCALRHKRFIGSPIHVKRVLLNILSNAVKYNREGGKVFFSCHETDGDADTATLEFVCRDTGIGISPEFIDRAFEPFSQENASPRVQNGTGLGLSIAHKIVRELGGNIRIESTVGIGSTFTVTLPLQIDRAEQTSAPAHTEHEQLSINGLRILLVEDNDLNMEIAHFLLENNGAIVTQARDGREAVELYEKYAPGHFDAILMDVMMPVMDGYEATGRIRGSGRPDADRIPIIAMTANAFSDDRLKAQQAGMSAHIAKPIDVKLLLNTIAHLVRDR